MKIIPIKTETICTIPWMHLNFEPNGKVVPCCLTSSHNYFAGDLTEQNIEEIWNSENMKQLRKEMINGIEPKICNKCFDMEKVAPKESGRYFKNRDFPEVLNKIPYITEEDGTCNEMELKYWDFRFSNLCNFKCRSCGPRYSSAWVPDAKKIGWISEQDKVWNIEAVDSTSNFEFLKDQVQHVEEIYFAGGEPLLMPEHWMILDLLMEHKRRDVKINYNTNLSTLSYGNKHALDYWKYAYFGKLEVWPSIDELDERAEVIRSGTVWSKIEDNLKELAKYDNIIVRPGITVGAWNVFRIPEIVNRLIELGVVRERLNYSNFFINLLEKPEYYHVHILSHEFRKKVIEKLENFIQEHNKKYNTRIDDLFLHIINELKKPQNKAEAMNFLNTTNRLDAIRNEDLLATIPELRGALCV